MPAAGACVNLRARAMVDMVDVVDMGPKRLPVCFLECLLARGSLKLLLVVSYRPLARGGFPGAEPRKPPACLVSYRPLTSPRSPKISGKCRGNLPVSPIRDHHADERGGGGGPRQHGAREAEDHTAHHGPAHLFLIASLQACNCPSSALVPWKTSVFFKAAAWASRERVSSGHEPDYLTKPA